MKKREQVITKWWRSLEQVLNIKSLSIYEQAELAYAYSAYCLLFLTIHTKLPQNYYYGWGGGVQVVEAISQSWG